MNTASTSGVLNQFQQSEPVHSGEGDIFFGRTTRLMWKAQTEQAAASQQSPKWNEPDTDYTPPAKKPKKEKHRESERHREPSTSTPSGKDLNKKKKSISVSKTTKTPKSSKHDSVRATTAASHSTPSQPKATAPPPSILSQQQANQKSRTDETGIPEMINGEPLDAKMRSAIQSIREAANTSASAAAIQDAIDSVLSQSGPPSAPPTSFVLPTSYTNAPSLPAPVPIYPSAPVAQAPPPPVPTVMPANSELVAEQRHTFMIPPTDPLYNIIVNYYFEFKNFYNKAKNGDPEITYQLRQDIENEKLRRNEINEATVAASAEIEKLVSKGVETLKDRLDKLGMHNVSDVTELLAGSKDIVTHHKGLTTNLANMESSIALEEQKLKMLGGPDALRLYNDALFHGCDDIEKLKQLMINTRPSNFVAQVTSDGSPNVESKLSPSSRRPRQPRPRQPNSNGKRGTSAGRKSDGTSGEDVELEIRQFVKHAMQVDNAVKEKERKARGNFLAAERIP
ncbi:hypothetical protein CAEBREN_20503 [Caenorhabditis brenneri]|uniref:Uncharacterized protein n=1 Tax=Caenorhabditis brenneri TaxID=135651 RepID=G0NQ14_CAEBE|nr:hypothetical protein CAEBREN_20503 [Caenorhabditis brenneri]